MRRSDPWISNFNEYLITACRSNMDIKFIWSGSDAKVLVYYITDYVTKMSLSFHDTFALVQKSITSLKTSSNQTDTENAIEKSRKLVLRCYHTLASQQELSGVQVASYLMNWNDHYTTHKFEGLFLIQVERYLPTQLNEIRTKQKLEHSVHDVKDDDVYDNEETINGDDNNDEEHFQIQSAESDKKYVLANTRVDYQYRFEILKDICLYDFVSTLYKKKMTATDLKYLSTTAVSIEENVNQKGRPPNERYPFQKQHPQTTAYLMLKYSNLHVPILYGPQIPSRDRDETRERYSRALLTLFVPWRTVADLCDCNQTWEYALKSRQHLISTYSQKIIENIQLLHECKKNRDEHLLQVIAESQVENDAIDPVLLPANQGVDGEYDIDDSDQLLELLGNLDEYTTTTANANKKSTENKYIEETIEAVENVGRFSHMNCEYDFNVSCRIENDDIKFIIAYQQSSFNEFINLTDRQLVPFVSATPDLAPILVFRNEVGTQLNCKAAIHNATQSGYTPIVCVAQDTCKDKPIEDPTFMKKLLEISDSKTEQLPGLLPFVPGMSAILTQNIAIELGFINGINGIFRQLVYQSDSISTDVLSQAFPSNTTICACLLHYDT
ncbi:unnamed protein product [Rotaria socialis]